jgi:hypothetical protein
MRIDGACHCGSISYEAEVDPGKINICHCTDCQILTGSAYRVTVPSLKGTFRLLGSKPKVYVKTAESGAKRLHAFCPDCGTPLYATADDPDPQVYGIRVGTVRQKAALRPATQGWCRSAQDWSMNIEALPRSPMQTPR